MTDIKSIEVLERMIKKERFDSSEAKLRAYFGDNEYGSERLQALTHALTLLKEHKNGEWVRKEDFICPHGIRHYEHYCGECSRKSLEEEYNDGDEWIRKDSLPSVGVIETIIFSQCFGKRPFRYPIMKRDFNYIAQALHSRITGEE